MREIKFRGKSLSGEWLYGDLVHRCGAVHIMPVDAVESIDDYEVDPATVGQYTGDKDKSRQEIYEGDIVLINHYRRPKKYVVIWLDGGFSCGDMYPLYYQSGNAEVIGNIHDNPELLDA